MVLFDALNETSEKEEEAIERGQVQEQSTSSSRDDKDDMPDEPVDDDEGHVRDVAKQRLQIGRYAILVMLLFLGISITTTTHRFLEREQKRSFETAFALFARTIADAAQDQQRSIRDGFVTLSETIGSVAQSSKANWPYFAMPKFETHAHNARIQSGAETLELDIVVTHEQRENYTNWVNSNYKATVAEGHMIQTGDTDDLVPVGYKPFIYKLASDGPVEEDDHDFYIPVYGHSPPPSTYGSGNFNARSVEDYDELFDAITLLRNETLFTRVLPVEESLATSLTMQEHGNMHSDPKDSSRTEHPHSVAFHPIHKDVLDERSSVVAVIAGTVAWDASLRNLPSGAAGIFVVIENTCNQIYTYRMEKQDATFLGSGDFHETKYDEYEVLVNLALHTKAFAEWTPGHCLFSMRIYPSGNFEEAYNDWTPNILAAALALSFFAIAAGFYKYDWLVRQRNQKIVEDAAASQGIVSSMFPDNIRDRLLAQGNQGDVAAEKRIGKLKPMPGSHEPSGANKPTPLADLFLDTSVAFADISGFTAWSSVREPTQVFTLLETLYFAFDEIAKRRRIFKVETVGDCYVAVAGLPDPMADHAVAIARFADDILQKTGEVTKELETSLGPDTGELTIKIGIHSGPVTGGVLSGDRSRFQLFGDTMNTASRMESTSSRGKIQVSKQTADLLIAAGKGSWVEPREDKVLAKGLGLLQTYWLDLSRKSVPSTGKESTASQSSGAEAETAEEDDVQQKYGVLDEKTARLVDWNVVILEKLLRQVVARRDAASQQGSADIRVSKEPNAMPLDEVKEIIELPEFDSKLALKHKAWNHVLLDEVVTEQLTDYVTCIASLYRNNPFHSFDHCSHVVMSVVKLMSRIIAPPWTLELGSEESNEEGQENKGKVALTLHDHTYGITSDPLTQFACVFSALIHDVDHTGVPNTQLINENPALASLYKERSVAEQNSLDIAWELLMDDRYKELRSTIYSTPDELARFRQLVVNSVMATDLGDKEMKQLRNKRWEKAFSPESDDNQQQPEKPKRESDDEFENARAKVNRKATIVIEHLIQASDVSHTMQHWHIYRKWNARLYEELYKAYVEGRASKDPSEFWYEGEMGFFDFYIIPLAKKLKDCGVFGKSSDEYLNYAINNRQEWEQKGKEVTAEMKEMCLAKYTKQGE